MIRLIGEEKRCLKVKDLVVEGAIDWNVEMLVGLFGYTITMQIIHNCQPPDPLAGQDSLIFKHATNGVFTVKKAYRLLLGQRGTSTPADKLLGTSFGQKEKWYQE